MADINDRLDRLQRREEFDRFGRPIRSGSAEPAPPMVTRPAGVDDRLGEVLDAVAAVVSRHPGLSVMVAVADGRAGRPVVRVTERDGGVETGVVVAGTQAGRPAMAAGPAEQAAAVPSASAPVRTGDFPSYGEPTLAPAPAYATGEVGYVTHGPAFAGRDAAGPLPVREPALAARDTALDRPPELPRDPGYVPPGRSVHPLAQESARPLAMPAGDPVFEPGGREVNGRHAAPHDDPPGWSGHSWHTSLWSRDRGRPSETGGPTPGGPAPDRPAPHRLDADRRSFDRPEADRRSFDRPEADRRSFDRLEGDRRAPDRPEDDRRSFDRPEADLRAPDRLEADRRSFDRPGADRRAPDGPEGDRQAFGRLEGDRRVFDRPEGDRRAPDGIEGDRRAFDRPDGDRRAPDPIEGDRRAFDRPEGDRRVSDGIEGDRRQEPQRLRAVSPERPTIPVGEDTSQVVSRLAQLLRENPTLASSWSREAPE